MLLSTALVQHEAATSGCAADPRGTSGLIRPGSRHTRNGHYSRGVGTVTEVSMTLLNMRLFSVSEAGRLLSIPSSTLSYWLHGSRRRGRVYDPVLRESLNDDGVLTWGEFIEAGLIKQLRERKVKLDDIRRFSRAAHLGLGWDHPLARHDVYVGPSQKMVYEAQRIAGLDEQAPLFLPAGADKCGSGQQFLFGETLKDFLEPIAFEGEVPVRYRPRPRHFEVIVDPRVRFGTLHSEGIPTEALWSLHRGGDTVDAIAESFHLDVRRVEEAIAFEEELQQYAAA